MKKTFEFLTGFIPAFAFFVLAIIVGWQGYASPLQSGLLAVCGFGIGIHTAKMIERHFTGIEAI